MTGLLESVRVIDLADEPGLYAGRMFAELGADVIRVEPPGGDGVRQRPPWIEGTDRTSLYHLHFNAGKRGVTLRRGTPRGDALLRRLVDSATILLTTCTRAELAVQGLDYASIARTNPGIVHVSVTPFGPDGPMSGYRANDLIGAAMSGLMFLNGMPDDPPNVPGAEQAYHMASLVAVSSSLVAMVGRRGSADGRGCEVTVSMQEAAAMATLQTANANHYTWHGNIPGRTGLAGTGARNLYECADGRWISFTIPVGTGPVWGNFVEWLDELGIEHEFDSPEWFEPSYRTPRIATVVDAIQRLCAALPRDEVFHDGQRRRLLTMPVNDISDLMSDRQLRERAFFKPLDHPALGRSIEIPGPAYHFSTASAGIPRPAPLVGEHNDEVFCELLGLSPSELRDLEQAGVI